MTIFQSKIYFLSANSIFAVQKDVTYLPQITRETYIGMVRYNFGNADNLRIFVQKNKHNAGAEFFIIKRHLSAKKENNLDTTPFFPIASIRSKTWIVTQKKNIIRYIE